MHQSSLPAGKPLQAVPPQVATKPTVAFTTPSNYATRLSRLLSLNSFTPLWCPTIATEATAETVASFGHHLSADSISLLSAIAFPSRTAIEAAYAALLSLATPLLPPDAADSLVLAALGKDAELLDSEFLLKFCSNVDRVRVLVPTIPTPSGLVQSLGLGRGRRVLCPVPRVIGVQEPPVVPDFLLELESADWNPVRVDAYETRWLGPTCAAEIVEVDELDAVIFTSTAEVEGLLKSLRELECDWTTVRCRRPELVVAAHGPVTAAGAKRLGVDVDVVSGKFESFEGVVKALHSRFRGLSSRCL
ncbi:unnamed protein product [Linum tenue]|uniref:Tetrapyrrole biosynthesis uroporphyrinogen III synthase domain-containing protein n=1 Tax=Linum tenue TaxID=586396 RepID=A0AAV0IBR3_9ROSI|nr:unnamed protein product [Linum tenue]